MYTMEYYSAIKKNEVMPFAATWMDLEIITLSEVIQTERQTSHDITPMWKLKHLYKSTCLQKQTHRHRKQTHGYKRRGRRRDKLGV